MADRCVTAPGGQGVIAAGEATAQQVVPGWMADGWMIGKQRVPAGWASGGGTEGGVGTSRRVAGGPPSAWSRTRSGSRCPSCCGGPRCTARGGLSGGAAPGIPPPCSAAAHPPESPDVVHVLRWLLNSDHFWLQNNVSRRLVMKTYFPCYACHYKRTIYG